MLLFSQPQKAKNVIQVKITKFFWQCCASITRAFRVKQGTEREICKYFFHHFGGWVRPIGCSRQKYNNLETVGLWGRKAFLAHSEKMWETERMNCKGKNIPWRGMTKNINANESGHKVTSFHSNPWFQKEAIICWRCHHFNGKAKPESGLFTLAKHLLALFCIHSGFRDLYPGTLVKL